MSDNPARSHGPILATVLILSIARSALGADAVFSDGFEAGGACHWSSGPCGQMVQIPAGEFTMGSSAGLADELPIHAVFLSTYWIDRTEVTVDQYGACAADGGCSAPNGVYPTSGCNVGAPWAPGNHPINCVDWSKGHDYCAWAGKRLPSEAEWEKAARGTDARTYPWGEAPPTCDYAVMYDPNAGGLGCGLGHTAPVGSKAAGVSPYGVLDMAGNVWEWVNDWYDPNYYAVSPATDPSGPATSPSEVRADRGGSWNNSPPYMRDARRNFSGPSFWITSYGFRCARDE